MLALVLAAALAQSPSLLRPTEVSIGLTGVGSAYGFRGGRYGDFTIGPDVRALAVLGGFTVNGEFLYSVPFDSGGVTSSSTLTARLGYTSSRFQLLAGGVLQFAPDAQPRTQVLPSVRAEVMFTPRARFSFSLFEAHGIAPAQFCWEQETFFVGYVAPLGLTGGVRVPLSGDVTLDVRMVAFRLYNTQVAMLTIAGMPGGSR